ncbi:hypothetical protein ACHAW5_011223 [Stephanodiscus triporus]|uniref:Uncharacterized protein n=1 Tax=Stephanodiscus triporus TaxID=2934178 RepID=A0ABD3PDP6_9STRA
MVLQTHAMVAAMAFHAMGNAFLLHKALFPLLEEDSSAMAHMDPSVIIGTPFPLRQLCTFVALSMAWNVLVVLITMTIELKSHPGDRNLGMLETMYIVGLYTIIIHFIFVLCGVHPAVFPLHTLMSALYVACNMLQPVLLFMPDQQKHVYRDGSIAKGSMLKLKELNNYIFGPPIEQPQKEHTLNQRDLNRTRCIHQYSAYGTIVGMVIFAILRVLDHGIQIQRYPCPIIIGATYGSCLGVALGAMSAALSC